MTTQIEAMKNALDALGTCEDMLPNYHQWLSDAKHELRSALDAAEKAEPSAEVVDLQSCFPSCAVVPVFPVGTLFYLHPPSAEIEELRRDAARYRWLREESGKTPDFYSGEARWMVSREQAGMGNNYFGGKIDAAIDAAMQEKQP